MATTQTTKSCKGCNRERLQANFYDHSSNKDGKNSWCKDCVRENNRGYQRNRYQQDRSTFLDRNIRSKYGISLEDYLLLREAQNYSCYVCESVEKPSNLMLDHNHTTGKVRKFLCRKCNLTVSVVEDIARLEGVMSYLEETD